MINMCNASKDILKSYKETVPRFSNKYLLRINRKLRLKCVVCVRKLKSKCVACVRQGGRVYTFPRLLLLIMFFNLTDDLQLS